MANHAILSPSGFKALMLCPPKPAMEMGLADQSSEYADEGTAAHFLASYCLEVNIDAAHCKDRSIGVYSEDGADFWSLAVVQTPERKFKVSDEMVEAVQVYLDVVRDRIKMYQNLGADVELLVEQALPIGHITGEDGATGTGDAVIIASFSDGTAIVEVGDLKYGRGVEVEAEENPQLKLYGLGAMAKFGMVYDFTSVVTWISQPRICHQPSEFTYLATDLMAWGEGEAKEAAVFATEMLAKHARGEDVSGWCKPHEDACRWCKAKPSCPALARAVSSALEAEFTNLTTADAIEQEEIVETLVASVEVDQLGAKMDAVELVEMWCKAIRGEAEKQLLNGQPVAGYKLVQGKRGNRAWSDADEAEKVLKSMRLKQEEMYEFKLISPTTATKVLKDSPKRMARISELITQADGKPSVARLSDKRPALEMKPIESEFEVITATTGAQVVVEVPTGAEDLV